MSIVLVDEETSDIRNEVAKMMMAGKSEYAVAKALHIKVIEAKNYWNQWKDIVNADEDGRDVARDYLIRMVKHFDTLIDKSYRNLEDLDALVFDEKISAQRNTTLKNISEYEAKRLDALQKAGLLDNSDLGDELAMREEREAQIIDILRNDLCPDCANRVKDKLTRLTGVVQGTDG